jgi:hypothetical protein
MEREGTNHVSKQRLHKELHVNPSPLSSVQACEAGPCFLKTTKSHNYPALGRSLHLYNHLLRVVRFFPISSHRKNQV